MLKSPSASPSTPLAILRKALPWGFFIASLLPLLALAYTGIFTRYLADDYATAEALRRLGFWQVQGFWYQAWSGRFSFTFLVSLVELLGVGVVPWLPVTALLMWAGSLFFCFRQLFRVFDLPLEHPWVGLLTNLVIFGTIRGFREYAQVIFWQTGILTYQVSIIFFTVALGLFLARFFSTEARPAAAWEYGAWFLAFLVGGGFSETWVIIQIALTGLALLAYAFAPGSPRRKDILTLLLLCFLASWAALLIIARSPGNMNRDTIMAELSFNLLRSALLSAFLDLPRFLLEWLGANTALVSTLVLGGLCAGFSLPTRTVSKNLVWAAFALLVGVYILFWAGFVPQYAVMGIRPAERALFMPMFLLLLAVMLLAVVSGFTLRSSLRGRAAAVTRGLLFAGLGLALLWVPVRAAVSYAQTIPELRLYASFWDWRDQFLRQAAARGEREVVTDSLRRHPDLHAIQTSFWIEADLQDDPGHWINQMAASYYGLGSIRLRR